jgi:hypothetical protein
MEKVMSLKKLPIPNPSPFPSSPGVRGPISVAISFDLLGEETSNDAKGKC